MRGTSLILYVAVPSPRRCQEKDLNDLLARSCWSSSEGIAEEIAFKLLANERLSYTQ